MNREPTTETIKLTVRQRQVLDLIATGLSSSEIAAHLHRSVRTVESHRHALNKQLRVRNSVELIRRAIELGLVDPEQLSAPVVPTDPRSARESPAERRLFDSACLISRTRPGDDVLELLCAQLAMAVQASHASVVTLDERDTPRAVAQWTPGGLDVEVQFESGDAAFVRTAAASTVFTRSAATGEDAEAAPSLTIVSLATARRAPPAALVFEHAASLPSSRFFSSTLRCISGRAAAELELAASERNAMTYAWESETLQRQAGVGTVHITAGTDRFLLSPRATMLLGLEHPEVTVEQLSQMDRRGQPDQLRRTVLESLRDGRDFCVTVELGVDEQDRRSIAISCHPSPSRVGGLVHFTGVVVLFRSATVTGVTLPMASLLGQLLDCSDAAMLLVEETGRILVGNRHWRETVRATPPDEPASPPADYPAHLARWFGDEAAEQARAAIAASAVGSWSDATTIALPDTAGGPPLHSIRVLPVTGLPIVTVRHEWRRDDESREPQSREPAIPARTESERVPVGADEDAPMTDALEWMFSHSGSLLAVVRLDGRILRANLALCSLLGRSEEDVRKIRVSAVVSPVEQSRLTMAMSRLTSGGRVEEFTLRLRDADGAERIASWTATPPLPGTDMFIAVGHEITEHARLREMLHEALSRWPAPGEPPRR